MWMVGAADERNLIARSDAARLDDAQVGTAIATFSGWMDEPGWLKSFTERGDCGSYLRIIEPCPW